MKALPTLPAASSLLAMSLLMLAAIGCTPSVSVTNSEPAEDVGLLVLLQDQAYEAFRSTKPEQSTAGSELDIPLEGWKASSLGDTVVGFTKRRPPQRVPAEWNQAVPLAYPEEKRIRIKAWIVCKDASNTRERVLLDFLVTNWIWREERMGICAEVTLDDLTETTHNEASCTYEYFSCQTRVDPGTTIKNWEVLLDTSRQHETDRDGSAPTEGAINVYYVDYVRRSDSQGGTAGFSQAAGEACLSGIPVKADNELDVLSQADRRGFAALGSGAGPDLQAHELAHNFTLTHRFGETNVTNPSSSSRRYLTEGQVFRAHFRTSSALNAVYGTLDNVDLSDLGTPEWIDPSLRCPLAERRIWPDGDIPAGPGSSNASPVPISGANLSLAVEEFLQRDCTTGDILDVSRLLANPLDSETQFLEALDQAELHLSTGGDGQDTELDDHLDRVESWAGERFDTLREIFKEDRLCLEEHTEILEDALGLTQDEANASALMAAARERYISRELDNYVVSYGLAAIHGTSLVGDIRSARRLAKIGRDSPLHKNAQRALFDIVSRIAVERRDELLRIDPRLLRLLPTPTPP